MRLLDVFQKPDFQPLDRGSSFTQFYEDGDKYFTINLMDFNYYYSKFLQDNSSFKNYPSDDEIVMLSCGGYI